MAPRPTTVPPAKAAATPRSRDSADRRSIWAAGLLLVGVIFVGMFVVAATLGDGPRQDTKGQLTEDGGAKPHIIPRPNEGRAPEDPGDPGGWAQLMLLGLIVVSLGGITVVITRGTRRARSNRQEWLAAAQSGHDGAVR